MGHNGRLSFHALASSRELKVTRTAPLYYFESKVGLVAAVAEKGFNALTIRLRECLEKESGDWRSRLVELSATHARYALEQPQLYRAMHTAHLWRSVMKARTTHVRSRAFTWIRRAEASRDETFSVILDGVLRCVRSGQLEHDSPHSIARLLTVVVDGYLFQVLEEHVAADLPVEDHLQYVKHLVDPALPSFGNR